MTGMYRQVGVETSVNTASPHQLIKLLLDGFFEALADWFESQTEAGILPTLSEGKTAVSIEASNWAYLYEQGTSDKGIYQIQCKLVYEQQP